MSAENKILLTFNGRTFEYAANAALKPGHLVERMSTNKVKKHATAGGLAQRLFAAEDRFRGMGDGISAARNIFDAYAEDDVVFCGLAQPGDTVNARLAAGAVAVVIGDPLVSNGDGCLAKARAVGGETLFAAAAASTALNTHTTITAFDVSTSLPANSLRVGDIINVKATVLFANASNSTETAVITLKVGALTIIATVALDHAAGDVAFIDAHIHVRAVGASGSIVAFGMSGAGPIASGTMKPFYTAAQTLDTTAAAAITVSQTCSGSNANTGGQLVDLVVERESINPGEVIAYADEAVDNSGEADEALLAVIVA